MWFSFDHFFQCFIALAIILIPSLWILIAFAPSPDSPSDQWYKRLKKPAGSPSITVNTVLWALSYVLMGFSSYIIFVHFHCDPVGIVTALLLFSAQFLISLGFAPLVFGEQNLLGGIGIITTLLPLALWTTVEFYKVSHIASFLMIPYLLWLGYDMSILYQLLPLNTRPSSRR